MTKIKTIFVSKFALIFSFITLDKSKNSNRYINLKKASAQEIEKTRCQQYDYVA